MVTQATDAVTSLDELHAVFRKHLFIPDPAVVDFSLGTVVAHRQGGEPAWGMMVGSSGGGKTEAIRALNDVPEIYPMSQLTKKTLLSGMPTPKDENLEPILKRSPSLLIRMNANDQSFIAMKDFTTVLQMRREDRQYILAQLREAYDGYLTLDTGSWNSRTEWAGRLGFLAGVTPVIDTQRSVLAILGERFLYLRLAPSDRKEMSATARRHVDEDAMRTELKAAVMRYLDVGVDLSRGVSDTDGDGDWLDHLAMLASQIRTAVQRDEYRPDQVLSRPEIDAPTRLVKQLSGLYGALIAMGHADPRGFVRRVARDSVPRDRVDALGLLQQAGELSTPDITKGLGFPAMQYHAVRRLMQDLEMLELVRVTRTERKEGDDKHPVNTYRLSPEAKELFLQVNE